MNGFLAKILIVNPMTETRPIYVKSVKEIHDFVDGQFTDAANMPQDTESMSITIINSKIMQNNNGRVDYVDNPEYIANI